MRSKSPRAPWRSWCRNRSPHRHTPRQRDEQRDSVWVALQVWRLVTRRAGVRDRFAHAAIFITNSGVALGRSGRFDRPFAVVARAPEHGARKPIIGRLFRHTAQPPRSRARHGHFEERPTAIQNAARDARTQPRCDDSAWQRQQADREARPTHEQRARPGSPHAQRKSKARSAKQPGMRCPKSRPTIISREQHHRMRMVLGVNQVGDPARCS